MEGKSFTVRFGRIGSDGQVKTKTAASPATAEAEVAKLVAEKLAKGYREVSGDAKGRATGEPARTSAKPAASAKLAATAKQATSGKASPCLKDRFDRGAVRQRVLETHGLTLPDHVFEFVSWWNALPRMVTRLLDREAVMNKLVYAATNPVKDGLVDDVWQWPGVNGYMLLKKGEPVRIKRPRYFFTDDGTMPEEVELRLTIPPELGTRDEVLAELEERVKAEVQSIRQKRIEAGRGVLGRAAVLKQSWRDSPANSERRRTLRPRFAGSPAIRITALLAYKEFLAVYDDVRRAWLRGAVAAFPRGTYWLARFAPTTTQPLPE